MDGQEIAPEQIRAAVIAAFGKEKAELLESLIWLCMSEMVDELSDKIEEATGVRP